MRNILERAENLAEQRDRAGLMDMVAADYGDAAGRNAAALDGLLRFHFLRNRSVHLLVRIESIAVSDTGLATAEVLVALAGQPISDPATLTGLRVDLLRLDLTLSRTAQDYRLIGAAWRRASAADFLP